MSVSAKKPIEKIDVDLCRVRHALAAQDEGRGIPGWWERHADAAHLDRGELLRYIDQLEGRPS